MPKRRDQIRMSDDEVWDFIASVKSMQTATINKDGTPHLTTNWFGLDDRTIVFETYTRSQKIVNLSRDPRIALLWEDGTVYEELRGVAINGTARLYHDPEEVWKLALHVVRRNNPEVPAEQMEAAARGLARKRTGVVIDVSKIVSWDHRRLGDVAPPIPG